MSASIRSAVEILSLLLDIVVIARLIYHRLFRVYPFFFAFLCITAVPQAAGAMLGARSHVLFYCYVVVEPIRNILYILVVWELFSVIFQNYAGLRTLSRWVMGVAAAIAPLGFILTMAAPGEAFKPSRYVSMVVRFERGVAFGLVIFIIIMLYFISRYPIKLPRNSVAHCLVFSVLLLGDAAVLLASSFLPKDLGRQVVNNGQALLEIGCYIGWALLLSKAGEYQETRVRRDIAPEDEKALIGELDAMNALLLRAGRSMSHTR
jgi:hypothetical protein